MRTKLLVGVSAALTATAVAAAMTIGRGAGDEAPTGVPVANSAGPEITVYKGSTCGCCNAWIDHMKAHGFRVTAVDVDAVSELMQIKARHGITPSLASCHTALVGDYVIEGHVPADLVTRLLAEQPAIEGLAVPGMPMGSPGMEGPRKDPYDVLAFDAQGRTTVYAER
jgi:hypothetical protein